MANRRIDPGEWERGTHSVCNGAVAVSDKSPPRGAAGGRRAKWGTKGTNQHAGGRVMGCWANLAPAAHLA